MNVCVLLILKIHAVSVFGIRIILVNGNLAGVEWSTCMHCFELRLGLTEVRVPIDFKGCQCLS